MKVKLCYLSRLSSKPGNCQGSTSHELSERERISIADHLPQTWIPSSFRHPFRKYVEVKVKVRELLEHQVDCIAIRADVWTSITIVTITSWKAIQLHDLLSEWEYSNM